MILARKRHGRQFRSGTSGVMLSLFHVAISSASGAKHIANAKEHRRQLQDCISALVSDDGRRSSASVGKNVPVIQWVTGGNSQMRSEARMDRSVFLNVFFGLAR